MTEVDTRLARALRYSPLGSQTRSKAPGRVGPPDTAEEFPLFAYRGEGAYLWTEGYGRLLDFAGANAAVPLGYTPADLVANVMVAVSYAPLLSLPSAVEADVSEALCRVVPCARDGQVRFVKTGSEATTAALLIARRHTGRRRVFIGETAYHGWHEWAQCRYPIEVLQYAMNDPYLPERIASARPAAVFFEPPRFERVDVEWLAQVRTACTASDVLLVFDEMVAGFRLALAGGQERYGVTPDLACFGKALGNGYPIACVLGRRDVMAQAADIVSGTYGGDRVALAAAQVVLRTYAREDVIGTLWRLGQQFWQDFYGWDVVEHACLEGTPVHWRISLTRDNSPARRGAVCAAAARRGVLFHRDANNASAAMTEVEVCRAASVLAEAVKEVCDG